MDTDFLDWALADFSGWLMLDSRVVMAPFRHNRLFLKVFSGGLPNAASLVESI
jgi:hypothetical protein